MGNITIYDGELIKVKTYDGSLESAQEVLKDLNIEDDFYRYNIKTRELTLIKKGLTLRPDDCYQYRLLPQPIKATG